MFLSCAADGVQSRPQFVVVGPSLQVQADEVECPFTDGASGLTCQNQSSNQCHVNLNANSFRFAADQTLTTQKMFQPAKEEFDRPAQFVDGSYDVSRDVDEACEKNDFLRVATVGPHTSLTAACDHDASHGVVQRVRSCRAQPDDVIADHPSHAGFVVQCA